MKISISLEPAWTRLNECIRLNEGGSVFAGYLTAEVTMRDESGEGQFKIGLPDLELRITRKGTFRVDVKQVQFVDRHGKDRRSDAYWPADAASRHQLTVAILAHPEVREVVRKAFAGYKAAKAASADADAIEVAV